jgi:dihydrofolate synthase/folylpolyglutamate synthase
VRLLRGRAVAGRRAGALRPLTYREALASIQGRRRFGVKLGLARIRGLLRELGHPERSFRGALIAGTNGKGSVLALAGAALEQAGYRVGRTPKPHLVTYRERLAVGERLVEPETFAALLEETLPAAERVARTHGEISEFEFLTAMAFLWFAREKVDLALVEVGLGGRLDATNAWDGGVAAITNIDWDHMDRLGDTLAAIGREKAAIVKRGDVAVTGAQGDGLHVIERRCRRLAVPLTVVAPLPVVQVDRDGIVVGDVAGHHDGHHDRLRDGTGLGLRVGLRGRHQAANAAVALAVLDALAETAIARVGDTEIARGFATASWPGRLERLDGAPAGAPGREIWLDGAHNAGGAAALVDALREMRPFLAPGPLTLVLGIMADKDVPAVLAQFARLVAAEPAGATRIITTRVDDSPRAMPALRLADQWRQAAMAAGTSTSDPIATPDPRAALTEALSGGDGGPIVVAGSLYLVGAVRERLVDDPRLRDPES